jgi:hypothetical protein
MQAALIADGEKLAALTGEDHGPYFTDTAPTVAAQQCAITPAEVGGLVDAQTEARAIALKIASGVIGNMDAEHVERFGTKVIATALATERAAHAETQQALEYAEGTNEVLRGENQRVEARRDEALKALGHIIKRSHSDPRIGSSKVDDMRRTAEDARRAQTGGTIDHEQ